jgi:DNA polymerase-1
VVSRKLFLVDGSSYIYRAFHALPYLSNSKGMPTNAVFGFTNMIKKLLKEFNAEYIAVIFDSKGKTFRDNIYKEYKANRPEMDNLLIPQIPYIKKILKSFGITVIEKEGYEADDIIGTIAKNMEKRNVETLIITGDKDMLQLVTERINTFDPMRNRLYNPNMVREKYGIDPPFIKDLLGLAGDPIDNIPGVPGIGEKGAIELIKEFGSIEDILNNIENVKSRKKREGLITYKDLAILSKRLATIDTDINADFDLNDFKISKIDIDGLREILKELEFTKLLREIPPKETLSREGYLLIVEKEKFIDLVERLRKIDGFAIDIETTSKSPMFADIVGISIAYIDDEAYYIPLAHKNTPNQLNLNFVLNNLKPILEDSSILKYGQNIKYDYIVLKNYGISLSGIRFDTMIASYLINPSKHNHNLEELAREYLDHQMIRFKDIAKNERFDEVEVEKAKDYSCEDVQATLLLTKILAPKVKEDGFEDLFNNVEIPLIRVLAEMEINGVRVDNKLLNEMSKGLQKELNLLEEKIYNIAGERFNINSPKQLSNILFNKLKLPTIKKTKTGYSTDVDVLTELSKNHELPAILLEYRTLSKLKSTYIDTLPKLIHPKTGRIHTSYNQTVTATGRLSSSDPNLQNIPLKTVHGKSIRSAFIPENGYKIVSADYSQIELRILAHITLDNELIKAFKEDKDIHRETAATIFGVEPARVTDEMRRKAKVINFGIIYGMSPYGLAKELNIDYETAENYIINYFDKYQGVKRYIDETINRAKENGYVLTLLNRRRYIPEILSDNINIRQFGERTAINTPIQGSAADLIKMVMIKLFNRLGQRDKMIIQIHDELVFEIPEDSLEEIMNIIKNEMENIMNLNVPLKIDINYGNNWEEAH